MKAAGESMSIRGAFWAICAVMRSYLAVTCLNVVFVAPKQPDVPLVTVQSTATTQTPGAHTVSELMEADV